MRRTIGVLMLALAFVIGASVSAPVAIAAECDDACCDTGFEACCDPCADACCGGLVFDVEFTFLQYNQEGGVTDQTGSSAEFDYELAPRFELGYVGADGLGLRTRYWELDDDTTSAAGNPVGVDTYNIDLEVFQQYCLGHKTTFEIAFGLRYMELWQGSADLAAPSAVISNFSGFGGTMAAEAKRAALCGNLYARARMSVLVGDAGIRDLSPRRTRGSFADDCTATQTELGLGYEICRSTGLGVVTLRGGYEWQNWANMAVADTSFGGIGNDDVVEDAGFSGFVIGLGLER